MNHTILTENKNKLSPKPLWMLLCFSMYCFWQMGFIYFMGPSLTINGRTPLPVSMDNITTLIAIAYVLSIIWMYFVPKYVIYTDRITTILSLITAVGLFFPFSEGMLRFLIYSQVFLCCFMIGFETFVIVNYFDEKTAINHLTVAYGVALLMIAFVQNDFYPITFPTFRIVTVIALILLLVFFFRMPEKEEFVPRYVRKSDGITSPKKLLTGTFILIFIASLMAVSGPAISGEVKHGVFITYLVDALVSIAIYFLYAKLNFHPFKLIPACMAAGCVGFLLMFATTQVESLKYLACALIGFGLVPCQMLPLYNVVLMQSYPTKILSPATIFLALVAVLVQSSMVEVFRNSPVMLYLVYAILMVVLALCYLQIEPFFLYTLRKKDEPAPAKEEEEKSELSNLTKREMEVVDLICYGYTNADIAKMLYISQHTVKDHTKNIYRKLDVHSRIELANLVNKLRFRETK